MKRHRSMIAALAIAALLMPSLALAARTQVKPGWNMMSREQDVQLGREAAAEAERQLPIVRDAALNAYVNDLGRRLARYSPAPDYPYTFKAIADQKINAFALPGGPIYLNVGVITQAQNEAQVAGVLAHEIAHVALRHGTSNASKAMLAQMPLAILGGVIGSGSILGQLAQLGIGFGLNSVFMKYSRDAERQADIIGTQMLYDAGYDPEEMAKFFEHLASSEKSRSVEWLSSHPSPGNRVELVRKEIANIGPQKTLVDYGPKFNDIKARAGGAVGQRGAMPQAGYGHDPSGQHTHPQMPSGSFRTLDAGMFRMAHPSEWQAYGQNTSAVTIAPQGGIVQSGNTPGLAYGAMISLYQSDSGGGNITQVTNELIQDLHQANPDLRVISGRQGISLRQTQALSVFMRGRSPIRNEPEINWLVSAMMPDGTLWYVVFVAPERDFNAYRPTFERMLDSVQFAR